MTGDKEVAKLEIEFARFTATVEEWMVGATEHRKTLCSKVDLLFTKTEDLAKQFSKQFSNLPCPERKWIPKAIYILYGLNLLLIAAIITEYIKSR